MEDSMNKLRLTGIVETTLLEKMANPLQFLFNKESIKKKKIYSKLAFILCKA